MVSRQTSGLEVLQIGVGKGGSARTWAAWFPDSRITGLDVRRVATSDFPGNVDIVHGDQTDVMLLGDLCRRRRFDLVIDDGSDEESHKIQTFMTVFPWLAPNARYICVSPWSRDEFDDGTRWQRIDDVPITSLGGWFGDLGAALSSRVRPVPPLGTSLEMVLHRAKCVTSCVGSVIVQSRS